VFRASIAVVLIVIIIFLLFITIKLESVVILKFLQGLNSRCETNGLKTLLEGLLA